MSTKISGTSGVTFPDSTSMQTGQQACKAWVNFNGTGTVAIRGAFNVSSVTDNGTGNYTVNFTTAMPDVNYSTFLTIAGSDPNRNSTIHSSTSLGNGTKSTTTVRVLTGIASTGTKADSADVNICIFR